MRQASLGHDAFMCPPSMRLARGLVVVVAAFAWGCAAFAADDASFGERVEPILRERCYGCHSHAAGVMEADLTLDWQSGWAQGGSRGPAIVPGDPEASLLIRAIRHADSELMMPEERLPEEEIAVLVAWVAGGAVDPRTSPPTAAMVDRTDWWSLRPLDRPEVPAGAAHPIDAFVDARLKEAGLEATPEADRRTLIRRLTIDLHGLPPTPEEVDTFVNDAGPAAYERLVDRLLASPGYGERWARHWLDTIHFADTHGFEHDAFRPHAWRYRDYVIKSFNDDLPWDRFVREQFAADVFFPEATDRRVALGYLGAGPYDHSAASTAPRSFEHLDRDDMVNQVMGAFASTTASCARCHAHKFDPVSQDDYYALQAVFAGIGKGDITFDPDPQTAHERNRWEHLAAAVRAADEAVLLADEQRQLVAAWEAARDTAAVWQPLELATFSSAYGATLEQQPDGSLLVSGHRPDVDVTTLVASTDLTTMTALRLEVLADASLPVEGPGRADNGNLHLNEVAVEVRRPGDSKATPVAIAQATADFNQDGWTIAQAIDGDPKTAWGIHPAEGSSHQAVFTFAEPLELEADARLTVVLRQIHGGSHLIGRLRLTATDGDPLTTIALGPEALAALEIPAEQRSHQQQLSLATAVLAPRAQQQLAALPPQEKVYAAASVAENERGTIRFAEPREIHVLKRGDIDQPGRAVGPGALSAVTALEPRFDLPEGHDESARRAALADWLVDPANPLTWRSLANRVWHFHFSRGLSNTPNDFGRMGSEPTHPHLLDWLACEIREHGSLKKLHRLICTSAAYRRSSAASETQDHLDPDNLLLARGHRRRLDADAIRDAILSASGRLDLTMGGPGDQHFSQRPGPQLTPVLNYDDVDWDAPGMTRRSIYRVVWRGIPDPFFDAFDFPDLGLVVTARGESVSPLQSLVLLNNRFVLHHADAMATDIASVTAAGPLPEQLREAVRRVWLREPTAGELAELEPVAEAHGMAAVCRLLFNSNAFLFVE